MLLHVYRLRYLGYRMTASEMRHEGRLGDLRLTPFQMGWNGRRVMLARFHDPDDFQQELIPSMEFVRVGRIRQALMLRGMEVVPTGRKSVEKYDQTWVCTVAPLAEAEWKLLAATKPEYMTGLDVEDDDAVG